MILDLDEWPVGLVASIYGEARRDRTEIDATVRRLLSESLTARTREHSRETAHGVDEMWRAMHPDCADCKVVPYGITLDELEGSQ